MQTTEQKQRKTLLIWLVLIVLLAALGASAQTGVKRNENGIFCEVKQPKDSTAKRNGEYFVDKSGIIYPIYVSEKGKHFVYHTSKKTKKTYKHYIVKIN